MWPTRYVCYAPGHLFYRATLCVSAVFAVARCLSVRLSVTYVHSIQTAEDVVNGRPGSPIILVFDPRRRYPISKGTIQRGPKIQGGGKFCDFRLKSPSISEKARHDRPMVAMER